MVTDKDNKIRVGLIFGGRSPEHDVSLVSARSVMGALNPSKYEVIPVGITRQGCWMLGVTPEALPKYNSDTSQLAEDVSEHTGRASLNCDPQRNGLVLLEKPTPENEVKLDVLFPLVHGNNGEDGTLQGMLEMSGLPYVGCGVLASAVGMDKAFSKRLFKMAGFYIPEFKEYLRLEWRKNPDKIIKQIEAEISYPCFIKPVNSGSSIGITKAKSKTDLIKAIDLACKYDRKFLVETFVKGREIEVSVLGNDEPIASIPGEIIPSNEFYDYNAKYIDNASELIIPADLSEEQIEKVKELAVKAYKALDCAGMARVDFFYNPETEEFIINEINTIPGFTSISMYPKLWEASGISYENLVSKLVELAIERHNDKAQNLAA